MGTSPHPSSCRTITQDSDHLGLDWSPVWTASAAGQISVYQSWDLNVDLLSILVFMIKWLSAKGFTDHNDQVNFVYRKNYRAYIYVCKSLYLCAMPLAANIYTNLFIYHAEHPPFSDIPSSVSMFHLQYICTEAEFMIESSPSQSFCMVSCSVQ